jgi:hypothetical protein
MPMCNVRICCLVCLILCVTNVDRKPINSFINAAQEFY